VYHNAYQNPAPLFDSNLETARLRYFAGEWYPLAGIFLSERAAARAARRRLQELERQQSASSSGGQDGIQDQVYIVRPDGAMFRYRETLAND